MKITKFKGEESFAPDYWNSELATRGILYLMWIPEGLQLLVPDTMKSDILEMETADHVIVSRGPWVDQNCRDSLELLFEDESKRPYAIQLSVDQCNGMAPLVEHNAKFNVYIWTSEGVQLIFPGAYRVVSEIPCLHTL